jgi:poly-gamma-glutamate system protein
MKKMYWSPKKASRGGLAVIACIAIAGLTLVELVKSHSEQPYYAEKVAAANKAQAMMDAIKTERLKRGYVINTELDPQATGMIGQPVTPVTTAVGHVSSKQASTNPNLAAAVVDMLKQAGVRQGDVVAVGYSGSFPAGDITVLAALDVVGADPIILGSVGASQYGANDPEFLWPDMEHLLHTQGHTPYRMVGCSMGGPGDRGLGLADDGQQAMKESVSRNGLPMIGGIGFEQSIDQRMELYDEYAANRQIKAYINVGGGTLSVGRRLGKSLYKLGLNTEPPVGIEQIDGIIPRFFARDIPVIHLVGFDRLAKRNGIVTAAGVPTAIGTGSIYAVSRYNPWLTGAVLIVILAGLKLFVLTDAGERVSKVMTKRRTPITPLPKPVKHRARSEQAVPDPESVLPL